MTAPRRCYIHIGPPKTGTSYLQSVFWRSVPALAAQDLAMLPASKTATFHLVLALRGRLRVGVDPPTAFTAMDTFRREAAELTCSRALVSQELLSAASPEQVAALLDALGGYEVHVVVTARDLASHIPSAWQEQVKVRGVTPYGAYLDDLMAGRPWLPARHACDLLGTLDHWRAQVPPERIHVVTVPKRGTPPSVLLARFCAVLEVDPAQLNAETGRVNPSLGLVQAELLRRTNVALGDRLPHARGAYRSQAKGYLVLKVLRPQHGEPPMLPLRMADWCLARSRTIVERVSNDGYDVVGDLDDLIPDASAFAEQDQEVSDAEVARAATAALASVLVMRDSESEELARLRHLVRAQRRQIKALNRRAGRPWFGAVHPRLWARRALSRLR